MNAVRVRCQLKRILSIVFLAFVIVTGIAGISSGQETELVLSLDLASETIPLPGIFAPNIDLSGRGIHQQFTWPQSLAAPEVIKKWQEDIGFSGFYRLQYNLWEIYQLSNEQDLYAELLSNYEDVIKTIHDAGGVVILNLFGTPPGLGKVRDKTSFPRDMRAFKTLVKNHIRRMSCIKKYNIWYEVWSAPDLDDFFLGRRQEYLALYRAIAESVKELEIESKIRIPIGGPGVSWWFQNVDNNSIVTPERSLIYDLIKFCYRYRLPLDFISWHAYSTNAAAEKAGTVYNKSMIALIRDWLSYFNFSRNTPLVVSEWNYDRSANVLPEREKESFICASYIPARMRGMYEAGVDYQLFFSLEDFDNSKEGVVRNTGIFWFDTRSKKYSGGPKTIYNVFKMLAANGGRLFKGVGLKDEFVGTLSTKRDDGLCILVYNYIDPEIVTNYLSNNISSLNNSERKMLLRFIESDDIHKAMSGQLEIDSLRLTHRTKGLLKKARALNDKATKWKYSPRPCKINLKNMKHDYFVQKFVVDSSCATECTFTPVEEKTISALQGAYTETLTLSPYSVQLIVFKRIPLDTEFPGAQKNAQDAQARNSKLEDGSAQMPENVSLPVANGE